MTEPCKGYILRTAIGGGTAVYLPRGDSDDGTVDGSSHRKEEFILHDRNVGQHDERGGRQGSG